MMRSTLNLICYCIGFFGGIHSPFAMPIAAQDPSGKLNLQWEIGATGSQASFRGISTPDSETIWLCGSQSTVLRSTDGGNSWINCSPAWGEIEFRSIVAHSATQACIASAGTPAVILQTVDSGKSWREVYRNDAKSAFFDSLKFWNQQQGIALSDPVGGKFLIVQTADGGATWQQLDSNLLPEVLAGEAAFAASNSSLLIGSGGQVWIGTGGSQQDSSRIHYRDSWQAAWQIQTAPIPSNTASGIFSLAQSAQSQNTPSTTTSTTPEGDANRLIVAVGGDYRLEASSPVVCVLSHDNGKSWHVAKAPPKQFRSAVLSIRPVGMKSDLWVTVGPTGSDYSTDGQQWHEFSSHGFHTLSSYQQQVFAAGPSGKFAKLEIGL